MHESMQLHNYNGTMAILSGLSKSAVVRLKKTWDLVPSKDVELFHTVDTIMSADHNYRHYRERLAQLERDNYAGPMVPFLGVFLRDLTFLNDGNPKMLRKDLVNYNKMRMIGERILQLRKYQASPYIFPHTRASAVVRNLLETMSVISDENLLYKCSLYCEPREVKERRKPETAMPTLAERLKERSSAV